MKRLFSLLLLLALGATTFAQQTTVRTSPDRASDIQAVDTDDDRVRQNYDRYLKARMELDLQNTITNALGLTNDEIADFQPFYVAYAAEKEAIDARRRDLIAEYRDEMAEDDSARDEENETADFIENYWELEIDELRLKKNQFDRLEDMIGARKALDFFALDKMYTDRMNRMRLQQAAPALVVITTPSVSYNREVTDFREWNRINIDGRVGLSHDFTTNGLTKLWKAAGAIAGAEGITVPGFKAKQQEVMKINKQLQKDWTSLDHADLARRAFTLTAETLGAVCEDSRFGHGKTASMQLKQTAQSIDPAVKLTDQAETVYDFFNQAERIVNNLVDTANRSVSYGKKTTKSNR